MANKRLNMRTRTVATGEQLYSGHVARSFARMLFPEFYEALEYSESFVETLSPLDQAELEREARRKARIEELKTELAILEKSA